MVLKSTLPESRDAEQSGFALRGINYKKENQKGRQVRRSIHSVSCGLCAALACAHANAAQNDFQFPTDYVALPDGAVNVAAYAVRQTLRGPWRDGAQLPGGEVDEQVEEERGEWAGGASGPALAWPRGRSTSTKRAI